MLRLNVHEARKVPSHTAALGITGGRPRDANDQPNFRRPPIKPAPGAFLELCGGYPAPRAEGLDPGP